MEASSNALADAAADEPTRNEPESRSPVRFRVTSESIEWRNTRDLTNFELNFDNGVWEGLAEVTDYNINNINSDNINSDTIDRGSIITMASTVPTNTLSGGMARDGYREESLANPVMEETQSTEEVKERIGMSQRIKMKIKTRYRT